VFIFLNSFHEFLSFICAKFELIYVYWLKIIDLSWKSSQIDGNTYSLLETERLLKDKETAAGKPKDDAMMLLNHKEALNFILDHPDYVQHEL
jgi:Fic family protein